MAMEKETDDLGEENTLLNGDALGPRNTAMLKGMLQSVLTRTRANGFPAMGRPYVVSVRLPHTMRDDILLTIELKIEKVSFGS